MPKFDWYAATVPANYETVINAMLDTFELSHARPSRPRNGYTHGVEICRGETVLASVIYGGVNGEDECHAWATSSDAPAFASFLRAQFKEHRVTRVDVAEDYRDPSAFGTLSFALSTYAKATKVKTSVAGDWLDKQDGRTLYLGAPASATRIRLYEKGKQLKLTDALDWVRCEIVVKPQGREAKALAATLPPEAFWGASKMLAGAAKAINRTEVPRFDAGTVYRPSDLERSLEFCAKQYGPSILKLVFDVYGGDWDAAFQHLRGLIEKAQEAPQMPQATPRPGHQLEVVNAPEDLQERLVA